MTLPRLELRPLRIEDEASFYRAVAEFAQKTPPWRFAFHFDPGENFANYILKLKHWSQGVELVPKFVPNTFLVGVIDGVVVGRLSLRHELNDFLRRIGGHIGYGVIPSQQGRGYATAMVRQALPLCAELGIARALVTCDVDNIASRRVIEKCGGIFESTTDEPELDVQKLRYWIDCSRLGSVKDRPLR